MNLPMDTHLRIALGCSALFILAGLAAPAGAWEIAAPMTVCAVVPARGFWPWLRSLRHRSDDGAPMADNDLRRHALPSPAAAQAVRDFDQKVHFQIATVPAPQVTPDGGAYILSLRLGEGAQSEELTVLDPAGRQTTRPGEDPVESMERCEITNFGPCTLSDLAVELHLEAYTVVSESAGKYVLGPRAHTKHWTLRFDLPAGREHTVVFHIRNSSDFAVIGVSPERAHATPVSLGERIDVRLVRLAGDRIFRWPARTLAGEV